MLHNSYSIDYSYSNNPSLLRERGVTIVVTSRYSRIADRVFDVGTGLCRIVTMDVPSFRTGRKW